MLSFVPIGAVRESWRLSPHLRTAFPIGPLIVAYVLPTGLEKPHAVSLSEKDRQRHDADVGRPVCHCAAVARTACYCRISV